MIEVRNASKRRGGRALWQDLSFDVADGEIVGLVGPSGCGKSTLLDCIGHIDALDLGTIRINGESAGSNGRRARLIRRRHLGYLFQDFGLVPDMTVQSNLDVVHLPDGRRRHGGLWSGEALDRVGLAGRGTDRVHELSGGEQQRVAMARLLVKRPSVILADEPTSALDDDNAAMVLDLLGELAADGAAVLVATHSSSVEARAARSIRLSGPAG
ncbi:ABC transporter ATP-binding protein [Curtobacterium flaccumfaciens]|uniref:ABC transporter ATP-binding protein n=1 Tax=Curtobacterium flaccumfaciens TaxID=2035 RepID=UPI001BDE948D|nr:ATP-binding cassette domain-containing protein [Curtobacterium flaccumfaciens]MBT1606865.1 ATP-binding cassette domain-containing protein [Curtobacterium flaccumfaciens pv. betae]MBT1657964.1 ATP-binding cassette domain-containing protein [Curtobacterium flaccumfaciens pv. betae]MCS0471434.1 ATP-binding cassette domain-containing protein [Curtobacterium flaccumfaciens pv. betae]MCS0475847.1 ATP-binding cassette domain-containing protein [Curtobacterium flaccumfaciens pv. betae]MCS0480049.1 